MLRAVEARAAPCAVTAAPPPPPEPHVILGDYHGYYPYAKRHICDFAVNLGQAAARELLYGKHYQGEPPATQLGAITGHMANAAAHLAATEGLLEPPFSNERPPSVGQVASKLAGYMDWRVGKSPQHRHQELENIWKLYQGTFPYTFVSSRDDAFQYNPTCDSQIHKVCFEFGRASIAAEISPADRQAIGADGVQAGSNSGMRSAIFDGLELAMDGRSVRPVGGLETSANRVCCAFGSPASWKAFPKFQTRSPQSDYTTAKGTLDEILAGAILPPGECGEGGFHGKKPVVPGRDCQCPPGTTEVLGLLGQSHCEDDVTHETVPHICDDVIDDELGLIYSEALQIRTSNPARAFRLMESAAQAGHVEAQRELGWMYYNGNGTSQDHQQASAWLLRAAEQGDAKAQNTLGFLYARGWGVEKDAAKAVYWFRKAAVQGLAVAQTNLGDKYRSGEGVEQDDSQAVYWYRKAAQQSYADAQQWLGYAYKTGRGVARDYAEAVRWYRLAADQGNPNAQNQLGALYYDGWGIERNYERALHWYERAIEQDYGPAFYNLGLLYEYGHGVNKDEDRAVELYREAARRGREPAQEKLRKRWLSW
ncbi:MAG: tetratricopeptide repeat protein [Acidobacteria bacterium]|nr:tetratricopeptide repeat protein [Acidobacteriota bacterium]